MKRKLFTGIAAVLLISGLMMLIAPRISNRVGEQIAHTTIEDFKALKSKATSDEPTEKNDSSENSISNSNPAADPAKSENDPLWQIEDEEGNNENGELPDSVINVDFDLLYSDSIAYNENLKKHQHELLTNEQSYQSPALNLSSYGITNGVYGYISAPSIGMELPIYLGGNDFNMAWDTEDDRHFYVVTVEITQNSDEEYDIFGDFSPAVLIRDKDGSYHHNGEEDKNGVTQRIIYGNIDTVLSTPGDEVNVLHMSKGETRTLTYGIVVDNDVLDNAYLRFNSSDNEIVDDKAETITLNYFNDCVKIKE